MKRLYTQKEVSRLIGVSESQIRYWDRMGLIPCSERQGGSLLYDFTGLVAFRTVKELLNRGISTRKIRKYLELLKKSMPDIRNLTEVSIAIYGNQVVIGKDNLKFTPEGQILINFSPHRKEPIPLSEGSTEALFFQALECEYMGDLNQAQKKYELVLEAEPEHSDVLVNLGNSRYRAGSQEEAERYYRKALRANPDHVEANYNLANLFEERGELDNAALFYAKSVHEHTGKKTSPCSLCSEFFRRNGAGKTRRYPGGEKTLVHLSRFGRRQRMDRIRETALRRPITSSP